MNRDANEHAILSGLVVTIDGTSGSGKSSTATLLAQRLGLIYLDTGAMYRTVTYAVLQRGIDPGDKIAVSAAVRDLVIEHDRRGGKAVFLLDGREVAGEIRGAEVSAAVSAVSRYPDVRKAMVAHQRTIGLKGGVVAEGRDTGSVVFPYAQVKIFLVADVEERTRRRVLQLEEMGIAEGPGKIRDNLERRDEIDSGRRHSPLVRPPGAHLIDTSNVTLEEQVSLIESIVRREVRRLARLRVFPGERNPCARIRGYYRVTCMLVRVCARIIFGLRIYGREHLRFREHYIFAANHVSYADPPLIGCALDRESWFVAKKELFGNRFFGCLIRAYHAIPINRGELDRSTVRRIGEILASGESVLMFPEGTRSRTGRLREVKSGIGLIALRSRVPVVPVYIRGSNALRDCMLRRERLEVRIGPPIRIAEEYMSEDRRLDYSLVASMIRQELGMLEDESQT